MHKRFNKYILGNLRKSGKSKNLDISKDTNTNDTNHKIQLQDDIEVLLRTASTSSLKEHLNLDTIHEHETAMPITER